MKEYSKNDLLEIWEHGTAEEKELLTLTMQAINQKRERQSAYLSGFMGLKGKFIAEDVYEFRIPVTPFMMNRVGIVHGGITATIADSTMGSLINQILPDGYGAVTAEMKVNYLKPGVGKELISQAKLVHQGQQLVVAQCEIKDENEKKIAFASGSFYVIKRR